MLLAWLTFASATIAAVLQGRKQVQGWIYDRLDRIEFKRATLAGWSSTGVDTWRVGLAEKPKNDSDGRPVTVTIAVLSNKGEPSADQADRLRRYLEEHDCLSRNPTPSELEVLQKATADSGALAFKRTLSTLTLLSRGVAHVIDQGLAWSCSTGRPPLLSR